MKRADELKKLMESFNRDLAIQEAVDSVDIKRLGEAIDMLAEAVNGIDFAQLDERIQNDPKLENEMYYSGVIERILFVTGYLRTL